MLSLLDASPKSLFLLKLPGWDLSRRTAVSCLDDIPNRRVIPLLRVTSTDRDPLHPGWNNRTTTLRTHSLRIGSLSRIAAELLGS